MNIAIQGVSQEVGNIRDLDLNGYEKQKKYLFPDNGTNMQTWEYRT